MKRESSQNKLWRGHGVAHKMQQNATKCNKMHQNVHSNMTELSIFNLSSVTYVIHFWSKWTLERAKQPEQVIEGSWGCA